MRAIAEASRYLIPALWAIWLVGWCLAAIGVKRAQWRESWREAVYNRLPVLLGMVLMIVPRGPLGLLAWRVVPAGVAAPVWGTVLTAAGLLFAAWARVHLGGNWSGNVTVKEGHTLITGGPYSWVRHPIYSGMTAVLFGTALAIGTARAFTGAALILLGFVIKLQVEEARMRETFPAEYDDYCRHTARLIPGVY
jgi:protein-S-isoprenylcysteine O-methyltransferase Ste14